MRNKTKMFIVFGLSILLIGSISAAYIFNYEKEWEVIALGGYDGLEIIQDLGNVNYSVNESLTKVQNLTIYNEAPIMVMNYSLDINITSWDGGCDATGDLSFELEKVGEGVIDPDSLFNMTNGYNYFTFTTTAVSNRVCPQTAALDMSFTE